MCEKSITRPKIASESTRQRAFARRMSSLTSGAGVTLAQGGVEPTVGSTTIEFLPSSASGPSLAGPAYLYADGWMLRVTACYHERLASRPLRGRYELNRHLHQAMRSDRELSPAHWKRCAFGGHRGHQRGRPRVLDFDGVRRRMAPDRDLAEIDRGGAKLQFTARRRRRRRRRGQCGRRGDGRRRRRT